MTLNEYTFRKSTCCWNKPSALARRLLVGQPRDAYRSLAVKNRTPHDLYHCPKLPIHRNNLQQAPNKICTTKLSCPVPPPRFPSIAFRMTAVRLSRIAQH
uniref:(northern house mosquito) hypothetical protein n=1 Tax=Culex pipiens TaxID=7175 RepID=A0A8D8IB18_CULPI